MFDVRFRRVAVVLGTLAAGGLLAACGSAGSSSSTTAASASASGSTSGTASARRAKLAACVKAHGVTLPARPAGAPPAGAPPAGGGSGGSGTGTSTTPRRGGGFLFGGGRGFAANPKLRSALQACGAQFGARGGAGGFRRRLSRTNITKYVTCVRQHGYNLPNPNFSGNGPIFPRNIQSNAKFQAASRACQSLLVPQRPPSTTSTTSGA